MTYLTPLQKANKQNDDNEQTQKPALPWVDEVIERMKKSGRADQESPLKRWWLEQQALKKQK